MISIIVNLINLFKQPQSILAPNPGDQDDIMGAIVQSLEQHHQEAKLLMPHSCTLEDISRLHDVPLGRVQELYEHVVFRDDIQEVERTLRLG